MTNILDKYNIKNEKKSIISETLKNPNEAQIHVVWDYSGDDYGHRTRKRIVAVPVFKDDDLQGFNISTYEKGYNNFGSIGAEQETQGEKFLSVDEYAELVYEIEHQKIEQLVDGASEQIKEGIKEWLNEENALNKARERVAHKIDKQLGTNIEKVKCPSILKLGEQIICRIADKVKKR